MHRLMEVYQRLLGHFGPQGWWPAETPFEVIVGALLTQQTAWRNVERAIENLKGAGLMDAHALARADLDDIAETIAPCGFYRTKPLRLKRMASYIYDNYGDVESFLERPAAELREELLSLDGIGPETADSILCYASDKLIFVVDAYTKRIGRRLGLFDSEKYDDVRFHFQRIVPKDLKTYREFHALMVQLGKNYCRGSPMCGPCPLGDMCEHARESDGD
ncbi:MAG: endonuclease III domain-containing protein [Thermoplasmata archaeon]